MLEIPVLIVGGGPVGLTASILLSHHGIRSLLIERHPGTAVHPKARGINMRTMEVYHQLGVAPAIRAAGLPPDRAQLIVWTRTLAGEEIAPAWQSSGDAAAGRGQRAIYWPTAVSLSGLPRRATDALLVIDEHGAC